MKVSSISQALNFLGRVGGRKNTEGEGDTSSPGYQSSSQEKQSEQQKQDTSEITILEVTDEMVDQAIQSFMQADSSQTAGLKVSKTGKGPGLRVVIEDINGAVIRQCSGKEFLRLQENSSKDARVRGRFLDQKL